MSEDETDQLPEEQNDSPQPVKYSAGAVFWRTEDSNGNVTYSTDSRWTKAGVGSIREVDIIEGRKRRTLENHGRGPLFHKFLVDAFEEEETQFKLSLNLLIPNSEAYRNALAERWADLLTAAYYAYVVGKAVAIEEWENTRISRVGQQKNVPRPDVETYHRVQNTARPSDFPQDRPAARRASRADEAVDKDEEEDVEEEEEPGVAPADNNPFAALDTSRTHTETKTKSGKTKYQHYQAYSSSGSKKVYAGKTAASEALSADSLRDNIMQKAADEESTKKILLVQWVELLLKLDQEKWTKEKNRLLRKGVSVDEFEAERKRVLANPQYYRDIFTKARQTRVDYAVHSRWYPFKCLEVWNNTQKKTPALAAALWRALVDGFLGAEEKNWQQFVKVATSATPEDALDQWVTSANKSEAFKAAAKRALLDGDLGTDSSSFNEIFAMSGKWANDMDNLIAFDKIGKWVGEVAAFELYEYDTDLEASGQQLSLVDLRKRLNYLLSKEYMDYILPEAEKAHAVFDAPAEAAAPEHVPVTSDTDWDSVYYDNLPDLEKSARKYAQARVRSERKREFSKTKKDDLTREMRTANREVTDTDIDVQMKNGKNLTRSQPGQRS